MTAPTSRTKLFAVSQVDAELRSENDALREQDPICADNPRLLIPPGVYQATAVTAKRYFHPVFKRHVGEVVFEIFDGPYASKCVPRFYSLPSNIGRLSLFYIEWTFANGGDAPRRSDRMSVKKFLGKLFRVQVETVSAAWDQGPNVRYSKVSRVLELLTTNEFIR
jgi:hypothetical protein